MRSTRVTLKPVRSGFAGVVRRVEALRAVQSETEKELSALMPSMLDRVLKGEL